MAGGAEALGTQSGKLRTGALLPDLSLDTIARFGEDDAALKSYISKMEDKHEQYLQYDPIAALSSDIKAGLHIANDEYWGESILTGYGAFSTSRLEYALEDLQQTHPQLFPDDTEDVAGMSAEEQEALLGSILKHSMGEGGTNEVLTVMQEKRADLAKSDDNSDLNQVEGMSYVIETSKMMVNELTREGTLQGANVQTMEKLDMAKGMLQSRIKVMEEQQTYNKIRTGQATFADIKKYKNTLVKQREERGAAVFRGQQIQDMINKYSAGVDGGELQDMEAKYGAMFGEKSSAMEALSTEKLINEKLDEDTPKGGDRLADEEIGTLYLKKIADGIDRLITMEGNRDN